MVTAPDSTADHDSQLPPPSPSLPPVAPSDVETDTELRAGEAQERRSLRSSRRAPPTYIAPTTATIPVVAAESTTPPPAGSLDRQSKDLSSSQEESLRAGATAAETATGPATTARGASSYWDPSAMAPLTPASAAAIARLRTYRPPPFPAWDRLPVTRRAAVLVLLYADRRGDLRVVITMRAASLRSFSGHAALPGGKADTLSETGYQIARREAWEEIGLPLDETKLPAPFRIEALCDLPCSLARTEVVVRPCVAFLHADDLPPSSSSSSSSSSSPSSSSSSSGGGGISPSAQRHQQQSTLVEEVMMPRLDAKEVAAVFSAPLHNFLRATDQQPAPAASGGDGGDDNESEKPLPEGQWYDGYWTRWHGKPWRVHNFHVPVHDQRVVRPTRDENDEVEDALEVADERFLVWGMTGRILVDVARAAYGEEPHFEHNSHYGDEEIIDKLQAAGLLGEKKRRDIGQEAIKESVKDEKM